MHDGEGSDGMTIYTAVMCWLILNELFVLTMRRGCVSVLPAARRRATGAPEERARALNLTCQFPQRSTICEEL